MKDFERQDRLGALEWKAAAGDYLLLDVVVLGRKAGRERFAVIWCGCGEIGDVGRSYSSCDKRIGGRICHKIGLLVLTLNAIRGSLLATAGIGQARVSSIVCDSQTYR